jgi:hypothetical protein
VITEAVARGRASTTAQVFEKRFEIDALRHELSGEKVLLKSKSWAKIKVIIDKARALEIAVLGSL